jgi:hypothetical protein
MVRLEVRGQPLVMTPQQAERLRAVAAAEAGRSARARDLSLVVEWALSNPRLIVLRRGEANELVRLVRSDARLMDIGELLVEAA